MKKTILVVDDDPAMLRLVMRILAASYDVVCTASAKGAMEIASQPGRIDLLLCDVVLPGEILGPLLARQIKAGRPEMRVILMSGETGRVFAQQGWQFLEKPFFPAALLDCIHRELQVRPAVSVSS